MKQFIEKLIARLKEKLLEYINKANDEMIENGHTLDFENCLGHKEAYENVLYEIVNELAEEYNNGWISCEERLPEEDGKRYLVQQTNGIITDLRFAKDAYKVDKYDFAEYKGKKKALFYDYDSEYGFIEIECEAWMPLPSPYKKGE